MPLLTSGAISIGGSTSGRSVNLELGRSATLQSSLDETALRTLAGKSSGIISLADFYGKSSVPAELAMGVFQYQTVNPRYYIEWYDHLDYPEVFFYWNNVQVYASWNLPAYVDVGGFRYTKGMAMGVVSGWAHYKIMKTAL